MTNYKDIFGKVENTLKQCSSFSKSEFDEQYGEFKKLKDKKWSDKEIFQRLTMIIFYSGFRASVVEDKEQIILNHFSDFNTVSEYTEENVSDILADATMIRNERKIRSCIANAETFKGIVNIYGSFQNYLNSFEAESSFENLTMLKEELEYRFKYLGGVTVYHFLTDIGFQVLKPDRVISRIFKRLGLIENEKQLLKTVIHGRKFARDTQLPIRYIDIILVKYGQEGISKTFGLSNGICLDNNPKCEICKLKNYCNYFKSKV